ncbi:putative carboxypeptidase [Colletotrichum chlorophyti]|uniref:Putative carboxypeptidase n=1 Tax=Colletotrichum chlorophyti TaxID=708187 RepID=A0A1Q8S395_9PEZI|nr:putative carboxypeptidase [Colletotrichum chlorophyti]
MSSFPPPIIPKALPPNAKIALISPSARINPLLPSPLSRSETLLRLLGYTVTTIFSNPGESLSPTSDTSVSASIRNRLSELRTAFADPTIDLILCTVGGSTMTELIPALVADEELHSLIRQNPKLVVGYSDITVLHWCLRALTGLRTFYGPCAVTELGESSTSTPATLSSFPPADDGAPKPQDDGYLQDFHLANLLAVVSHPHKPPGPVPRSKFYAPLIPPYFLVSPTSTVPRALAPSPPWTWLRPGRARGPLFGGCLTVVSRIQGISRITPPWEGRILFLESAMAEADMKKGNPLQRVRQSVADLAARGVFDEIEGLVIGRPYGYNSEKERAEYAAAFTGVLCRGPLAERAFPILMNVDVGHTAPMVTLPMDALAVLDSEKDEFAIEEAVVV